MRMLSIAFENTQSLEYEMDSTMEFRLKFAVHIDEPRVRVRVILQNSIASPVGMTQTEPFEVKAGQTVTRRIRLPLDGLAPGEYIMRMSLISGTPIGLSMFYDTIMDVSRFIVTDDPAVNAGFKWSERVWGNGRLKALELDT